MGALAQRLGTAGQAAKGSILQGALGLGLSTVGDISSGIGQAQQYNYMAQVAANNAEIQRQNEQASLASVGYEESAAKLQTTQTIASQKAAQAANGIDVNVGSPVAVRNTTATLGAMDAAALHYNAARQAFGLEADASNLDAQAALDRAAGKNAKAVGFSKAASTLLTGASSLSSKWAQFKYSGAL